ncbi:MAG TPA: SdrD B-like domain-containing protein, partial [Caldilineaceae bacterium]|nr:SdrD B-like domain-containing protein [Caldilineaceae bacterium]
TGLRGGHIQGVVFRDDDYDGVRSVSESPVAGVTVTVYDRAGASQTTVTDALGRYHFSSLVAGQQYRVEFAPLPANFAATSHGQTSQSSLRFVTALASAEASASQPVDFGLLDLLHGDVGNCNNPSLTIATTCFAFGPRTLAAQEPAIYSFSSVAGSEKRRDSLAAYDDPTGKGGDGGSKPHVEATTEILGAVNGLAYQRSTDRLFAAAFMKRHSEFGRDGTGAVYRIERKAQGAGTVSLLTKVPDAGADPHPAGTNFLTDPAFDQVGKIALGGLVSNADQTTLYTINLANRTLVEIPIQRPVANSLGVIPDPGCVAGVGRPFALAMRDRQLYVGGVCTAENGGTPTDLKAYVYRYDLDLRQFSAAPVLEFALNYPRGCADRNPHNGQCKKPANWQPWVSSFEQLSPPSDGEFYSHPQPWLTDIEFDGDTMVLGFRDRMGDLFGVKTSPPNGQQSGCNGNLCSALTSGDILRAGSLAGSPGQWALEQNGTSGATTTAGRANGQGPGNGEYYFEESFGLDESHPRHDEIAQGGLTPLPGGQGIATTALNPIPFDDPRTTFDGGVVSLSSTTGARIRSYRVYDGTGTPPLNKLFGKNNGLGDLELLCGANPPPLEIGNRVWLDNNGNGVQDADEAGIGGVTVQLYRMDGAAGELVGEAKTAQNGEYYFGGLDNENLLPGQTLSPETAYQLRIDLRDNALPPNVTPTQQDSQLYQDGHDDLRDADGDNGGLVVGFSTIALTTGQAGHNDHSFDFGFVAPLVALGN